MASPVLAVDPDQRYSLMSNGWFATSDFTSSLSPSGISTALNAQSTDSTATVISNVVGTVAQIAVLAAAAGAAPETPPTAAPELCQLHTRDAVNELYLDPASGTKSLKARVDDDTAALAAATAKVTLLTAEANIDKSLQSQLLAALQDQESSLKQLLDDQAKLTKDMNATTDTQVVTWPVEPSNFVRSKPLQIDMAVYLKWANGAMDSTEGRKQFDVYLALYRMDPSDELWKKPNSPATANVKVGVPVRLAATGRLLVCSGGTPCPSTFGPDQAADKKVITNDFQILQLGTMYMVPVTGGMFESGSAALTLDANGLPSSIQISEKASAAAGLSGAAKDTATQLAALPASVRAAQLAKTQAEINQLTANASLATAEAMPGLQVRQIRSPRRRLSLRRKTISQRQSRTPGCRCRTPRSRRNRVC